MITTTHLQTLVSELQQALDIRVPCGSITLNLNEDTLQSVKVETHLRIQKIPVDRRAVPRP